MAADWKQHGNTYAEVCFTLSGHVQGELCTPDLDFSRASSDSDAYCTEIICLNLTYILKFLHLTFRHLSQTQQRLLICRKVMEM